MSRQKHGHCPAGKASATYSSWEAMRSRCNNPNSEGYYNYGGRGIQICERWDVFDHFLIDMGERPESTSLDRIDPNGNYEPSNCRWASRREQALNRRTTRLYTVNGITKTFTQWCRQEGRCVKTIQANLDVGMPFEVALYFYKRGKKKCPNTSG